MKRLTAVSIVLMSVFAIGATSRHASAGPIIGDKEWYQPADLRGYSWIDFYAVCGAGACNGLLGGTGPDLTGWTWASIYEVGDLFAATSPHPGGVNTYQSPLLQSYVDFTDDTGLMRTTDDLVAVNFGLTGIAGVSSTLVPGGTMAYLGAAQFIIFPGVDYGSTFSTEAAHWPSEASPYIGAWVYRAAEAPAPATVWLIALGVAALRWSRHRTA